MNDLMTDSFVAAAAKAQQGGAAPGAGGDDPELGAFLAAADAAKTELAALRDELSHLRSAHEASKNAVAGAGEGRAATQAALVRLLGSARRLRARLASLDRRAPAPAAQAAAGLRGRVRDLTADVQALRRQVSAERRGDAARRYLAVAGDAPTEEQLDRLLASSSSTDGDGSVSFSSDAAMRAALLSAAGAGAEQEQEVAEVERGLLELQQLFLDMAALVEAQAAPLDDIERQVGAAGGDVAAGEAELLAARRLQGAARRRRIWLAGGIVALLLVGVPVAVVVALVLARRGGVGGGKLVLELAGAADLSAR